MDKISVVNVPTNYLSRSFRSSHRWLFLASVAVSLTSKQWAEVSKGLGGCLTGKIGRLIGVCGSLK
jgi:hypothetical protein